MRSTYSSLENQSACRCFKTHAFLNKHPPAKPVVFHVQAKPYNTCAISTLPSASATMYWGMPALVVSVGNTVC